MVVFSAEQLTVACAGVGLPARRWQLAAWADENCASGEVREALRHIPDRTYTSVDDLAALFAAVAQREKNVTEVMSLAG
jgi:hypothetical protein